MSISARLTISILPPITQSNLVTALQTAFTNAGFPSPLQTFTSGTDQIIIYRIVLDSTKTYGSIFLRLRITSALAIFQQVFSGWDTNTRTGTDGSSEVSYGTLSSSVAVGFNSFNDGNETRQIILTQNALFFPLGLIFPENRPSRWDLNSYPYGFIWSNTSANTLRGTTRNQYNNSDFSTYLNDSNLSGASPTGDGNDIVRGIILKSNSNNGVACQSSNNLGYGAAANLTRFTTIPVAGTTQAWTVINNVAGGLLIQTSE